VLARRSTIIVAVVTGVALELGVHALSGRSEAWDSAIYWTAGLPIALAISVAIGALSVRREWLWTFLIVPSQVTTMMVRSGEIGTLWPLTLVITSILGAPFVVASFVGSRFRPNPPRA